QRGETELVVEGGHAIDAGYRRVERGGQLRHGRLGKVTFPRLDLLEQRYQLIARQIVAVGEQGLNGTHRAPPPIVRSGSSLSGRSRSRSIRSARSASRTGFSMNVSAGRSCPMREPRTFSRTSCWTLKPESIRMGMSRVGPSVLRALARTIPSSS